MTTCSIYSEDMSNQIDVGGYVSRHVSQGSIVFSDRKTLPIQCVASASTKSALSWILHVEKTSNYHTSSVAAILYMAPAVAVAATAARLAVGKETRKKQEKQEAMVVEEVVLLL